MSTITALTDRFREGAAGQAITVPLLQAGSAIDTSAISAVEATLRSRDTGAAILDGVDVHPDAASSRGSFPVAGSYRITFTAADMAAVGARSVQRRELTLVFTHTAGVLPVVVRFELDAYADVT